MFKNIRFISRIIQSNFFRLNLPYKLTFALTYKCNLQCKTCYIWARQTASELTTQEVERFFKKANDFSWIDLSGGEIFTRPDLSELIGIILDRCRNLSILHFPTNGQLSGRVVSIVKQIKKHRERIILVITVSLDGPPKIHDEIKGEKGSWLKSLETFVRLKNLGIKYVYLGYTISEYNRGKLQDALLAIAQLYPNISYSDIHINIFQRSKHYFNNLDSADIAIDDNMQADLNQYLQKHGKGVKRILERRFVASIPRYLRSKQAPINCQALSASCFIDPYGDIYPCIIFDKRLSNIKQIDYDFSSFWNEKATKAKRMDILNKKCIGCWTPCEAYPALLGSLFRRFSHKPNLFCVD